MICNALFKELHPSVKAYRVPWRGQYQAIGTQGRESYQAELFRLIMPFSCCAASEQPIYKDNLFEMKLQAIGSIIKFNGLIHITWDLIQNFVACLEMLWRELCFDFNFIPLLCYQVFFESVLFFRGMCCHLLSWCNETLNKKRKI